MKNYNYILTFLFLCVFLVLAISIPQINLTGFFILKSGENASLALWDNTDTEGGSQKVYAEGSWLGATIAKFYANYTNKTSGEPITGVECNITFNVSGGWTSPATMWFNTSSNLYTYNRTFPSRGFYFWNVTCYGSSLGFDDLEASDNITISNTRADIYSPLENQTCYEDTLCYYNFANDCFDVDDIDENNLTYGYIAGTEFNGFSLDKSGMVTIDIRNDTSCGVFKVGLAVQDPMGAGANDNKTFIINAVNDKPVFGSLPQNVKQNSTLFYDVNATDEETPNGPFFFEIVFLECYRPFNNEHTNVSDCSNLFTINSSNGVINRSEIFRNDEVGNYTINISVTDPGDNLTGTNIPPYTWLENQTKSIIFNFTVIDINDRPIIEYVPPQVWTQNENIFLVVNASDIDNGTLIFNATTLYRNLSLYVNSSLFPISTNETVYLDNGTSLGNATFNFTPIINDQVGNYTLNITVDDGRENGTYSILVNITVLNINDPPILNFTCSKYAVEEMPYVCNVGENTTDPDAFPSYVPYIDPVNGTLTFNLSFISCSKVNVSDTNCSIFEIDHETGLINYTNPQRKDAGNYTLNISVTDGGNLTVWEEFNLTVVADYAPEIITSVDNQFTTQGEPFYLEINATDLDYEKDTLYFRSETYYNGVLLENTKFEISTNVSLWPSGPVIGVINYTNISNSQVGNYTLRIIVNDTWGREDYIVFNITVYNANDPPILNFSCINYTYETTYYNLTRYECNVSENTTDPDFETPYGDNLTYNISFINGPPFFTINSTTGVINFSALNDSWANDSLNFTYTINISVKDEGGLVDWKIFNITVYAVNDPPVFNFTNTTVYTGSLFFENVSAEMVDEENNAPYFFNVTFLDCKKANVSDTNCSIFEIDHETGVISFYAQEKDVGNYTFNVTVKDSGESVEPYNATGWKIVNFRILPSNHPPSVWLISVWLDNGTYYSSSEKAVFYENQTADFYFSISDQDGDLVNCVWYRNSTYIQTVPNCHLLNIWTYTPGFDEAGDWIIKVEASDSKSITTDEFDVTILNKNRPPVLLYPIQNQTWNMNTVNKNIVLSYHIHDPDNDNYVTNDDNNVTFNCSIPQHISVLIDDQIPPVTITPANWTGKAVITLTPQTDWFGNETMFCIANDSEYFAYTNNISLNVVYTETSTETIVQQVGGGGGGGGPSGTKIASLTITVAPFKRVTSYNKTYTNVTFTNTGQVPLNAIHISSFVKETDEIKTAFDKIYISQLNVGESFNSTLEITTFELKQETYEIKITGSVTEPRFNQSAIVYIRPIFNETKLEEKIKVIKDFFVDNPECLDLMELLVQAEKELKENRLEKAQELTETALENCRDIIRYANMTRKVTMPTEKIPVNEIIIVFLLISLILALSYVLLEKRALERKQKERK